MAAQIAWAQQTPEKLKSAQPHEVKDRGGIHLVASKEVAAAIVVGSAQERITGRVSLHMVMTPEDSKKSQVTIRGLNISFFGVSQKLLAGSTPIQEPLGVLGFAVLPGKTSVLRYDAQKSQLVGELQMYADASFLNAFAEPVGDGKNDLFDTPTVPTTASIRINLEKPLRDLTDEPQRLAAMLDVQLRTKGMRHKKFVFPEFEIKLSENVRLSIDIGSLFLFEVGRQLCVQPVRLLRFQFKGSPFPVIFAQVTGTGLAFGEPGARRQWGKANVGFHIRDWKTLFSSEEFFVTDEMEMEDLRALVDDDDCIEVFFVDRFSPQDLFGGGVTFGSGTASAKIISSDGNARGGVDLTHLAHELGHVLGLRHPDAAATASAQPANTGTLMCPSGFLNDNPRVNSQGNEDLVSNPLLTFALKLRRSGPDCLNSADCGACP